MATSRRKGRAAGADRGRSLLLEIGTEELPPTGLARLAGELGAALARALAERSLLAEPALAPECFASPRRLAVRVAGVLARQPERIEERRGPALTVAFDDDGRATRAATGFAASCGVSVAELERLETDKGAWLVHRRRVPGQEAAAIVPGCVAEAVEALAIARRMRWGAGDAEFVRPVHWLVLLHGGRVLPARVLGVDSGAYTHGHRFHAPAGLRISGADRYEALLEDRGKVVVSFGDRRRRIRDQVGRAARRAGGTAVIDDDLLDEVTGLVEWPHALTGTFDEAFLELPAEVLVSAMSDHQKYFHVVDGEGRLRPVFVTVSNVRGRRPTAIRRGNERVLRARLSDARFFWNEDRRLTLESRLPRLAGMLFHSRLGSLHDKTRRLQELTRVLTRDLGGPVDPALRAAQLCKADLVTEMVGEFPELQGTMGRHYAIHDGEDAEVAIAIEEHYLPRHAGDRLPASAAGRLLALADRADTLVGIFAAGEEPSGDRDPYGLRRAALGILRIAVEGRLEVDLEALVDHAAGIYGRHGVTVEQATVRRVTEFLTDRYRAWYSSAGFRADEIAAVLSAGAARPLEVDLRLNAIHGFRQRPEAEALAAADKRIRNILRRTDEPVPTAIDGELFAQEDERRLAEALVRVSSIVSPLIHRRDYQAALSAMAELREPVDLFFDEVMVMVDQAPVRRNRLALLSQLSRLFQSVADISLLQPGAEES